MMSDQRSVRDIFDSCCESILTQLKVAYRIGYLVVYDLEMNEEIVGLYVSGHVNHVHPTLPCLPRHWARNGVCFLKSNEIKYLE